MEQFGIDVRLLHHIEAKGVNENDLIWVGRPAPPQFLGELACIYGVKPEIFLLDEIPEGELWWLDWLEQSIMGRLIRAETSLNGKQVVLTRQDDFWVTWSVDGHEEDMTRYKANAYIRWYRDDFGCEWQFEYEEGEAGDEQQG
jgi:hypothetical protein